MVKVRLSKYMVRNPVDVLEGYIGHRLSKEAFLCIVAWTISLGGFIHGFILTQSQRLLDDRDFMLVANEYFTHFSLKFISAFYIGEVAGAVISFIFMDELGRRNTQIAANMLCLVSLISCSVTNLGTNLIYLQLAIGVCIGAQLGSSVIYLAEASSSSHRGRCLCFITMNMLLGSIAASLCTFASSSAEIFQYHYLGWRLSLIIPMVTLVFQVVMLYYFPESPRWLLAKKTPTDCSVSLCTLRRSTETSREFSDIYRALSADARLSDTFLDLLGLPPIRLKLVLTITLIAMQEIVGGQYAFAYLPQLLRLMNFEDTSLAMYVIRAGGLLGCIACFCLVDSRGRRQLLLKGATGMSIAYFMASLCLRYEQLTDQGAFSTPSLASTALPPGRLPSDDIVSSLAAATTPYTANHLLFLSCLTAISACYFASWGTVAWIYATEVFPYRSRAKLHALLTGGRYLAALVSITYLSPFFSITSGISIVDGGFHGQSANDTMSVGDLLGLAAAPPRAALLQLTSRFFVLLAVICSVLIMLVYFALPETRGLMLEDMDELFKLEPNAHSHHTQATPPSGWLHGLYNPHYCCFCLPLHGVLGWRVYTRTVRYVSGSAGSTADGGFHTPSSSHAALHYYQTYSNTHQSGLPGTPHYGSAPGVLADQPAVSSIGLYDEEEEQVLQIYEPSRLHKYSNEMRENKFTYCHHPYGTTGTAGTAGHGANNSVHKSGGYAGSDNSSQSHLPLSDEEEKAAGGVYGFGASVEVDEAAFVTPHKTAKGHQSDDDNGSDEESNVVHYFDSERNFLDTLIGSNRKGSNKR